MDWALRTNDQDAGETRCSQGRGAQLVAGVDEGAAQREALEALVKHQRRGQRLDGARGLRHAQRDAYQDTAPQWKAFGLPTVHSATSEITSRCHKPTPFSYGDVLNKPLAGHLCLSSRGEVNETCRHLPDPWPMCAAFNRRLSVDTMLQQASGLRILSPVERDPQLQDLSHGVLAGLRPDAHLRWRAAVAEGCHVAVAVTVAVVLKCADLHARHPRTLAL